MWTMSIHAKWILAQSETYTPVYSEEIARQYSINYEPTVHGKDGPVQVSYPKYFYNQSRQSPYALCPLHR